MNMMDDMLLKAGVDQQSEELTELSQVSQTNKKIECSVPLWLYGCMAVDLSCIQVHNIKSNGTTFR